MTASTWWEHFADVVPSWFTTYLTLEPAASRIRTYEAQFLPGLFQTAAYARAVIGLTHTDPADIDRRVELRRVRQRLLDEPEPPEIWALIGESALTQPPMAPLTPSQRCAQLDALIALTERPNITILIAAPAADRPRVEDPSITILSFADRARADVVYIEEFDDSRYLVEPAEIARYAGILADLSGPPRTAEETRTILHDLRARA